MHKGCLSFVNVNAKYPQFNCTCVHKVCVCVRVPLKIVNVDILPLEIFDKNKYFKNATQ